MYNKRRKSYIYTRGRKRKEKKRKNDKKRSKRKEGRKRIILFVTYRFPGQ